MDSRTASYVKTCADTFSLTEVRIIAKVSTLVKLIVTAKVMITVKVDNCKFI